jgi:hypothetical protein
MNEKIDMDGDAIRYPMVSAPFRTKRYGPLAVALSMMIGGTDGISLRAGLKRICGAFC